MPADGRAVDGSAYVEWTQERTVPDLRGLFLRGLNTFQGREPRADGRQDPDGRGRAAGSYQEDEVEEHLHGYDEIRLGWNEGASVGVERTGVARLALQYRDWTDNWSTVARSGRQTARSGGAETRPRNAAVYYYIKIN